MPRSLIVASWPDMSGLQELVGKMPVFVVYRNPSDFPDQYVVRLFDLDRATIMAMLDTSLYQIRERLPAGLIRMNRSYEDDPSIVEVWI